MEIAFFDETSTSSCTGSPILITYTQDTCKNRHFEVTNDKLDQTCVPSTDGHYSWQRSSCNENRTTVDTINWSRDYVVEERFMNSESCKGASSQAFAVAADAMCHALPMAMASSMHTQMYVQVNCNGGNPMWQTCWDAQCLNCTLTEYGNSPCKLNGAGTSTRVRCIKNVMVEPNTSNGTDTVPSDIPIYENSAKHHVTRNFIVSLFAFVFLQNIIFT